MQVVATASDGIRLRGWYWAPRDGKNDVMVYFHGNGGNQDTAAIMASPMHGDGHGLLVASYRGYGGNLGSPTEAGLVRDGAAFVSLARRLRPDGHVYLFGFSLGAGVALQEAASACVDGVALLGAFARLSDVAPAIARPFLPDRFDNIAAIRKVGAPIVLIHGSADEIVPFGEVEKLRAATIAELHVIRVVDGPHHVNLRLVAGETWRLLRYADRGCK